MAELIASLASCAMITLIGLCGIPIGILLIEVLAAVALPTRQLRLCGISTRPRIAVLIPAHNENEGLLPTIRDVKAQLRPHDRVLVVADNCTDETATVAAKAGAEVVEREDPHRVGKGYALDFGIRHLSVAPADVVIIVDADCRLEEGAIERLATAAAKTGRPMQALYLMAAPDHAPINYQVAEFAWRVRNWSRPLGLKALGLPCQLMGSGMAFPWDVFRSVDLASGHLVEDRKLGLDLAWAGHAPLFCPSSVVTSQFPTSVEGAKTQRERWERGHIGMLLTVIFPMIYKAIVRGNLGLLVLAIDMLIPPVTLLGLLAIFSFLTASLAFLFGLTSIALLVSTVSLGAFVLAIVLSWWSFGRDILPGRAILSIGPYAFEKLRLYGRLLSGRAVPQWIRTSRK
jgi:cellulose synthase/poly-beta-1,6-N-acetylglucosamine synthase-like glycosyltransferase